ncbi:MAG: hypothetical protein ABIS50_15950 [Luteolibacter sp.]|uniref:hypothetical protein n=1 Tax=Luteolibacter sp. TaxID=1962973 RepID=UPI0032633C13
MKSSLAVLFAFSAVTIAICQAAAVRLSWTGQGLAGDVRYGVHSIIPGESGSSETFPQSLLSSSMEVHDGSIYSMDEDFTNRVSRVYRTDIQSGSRTHDRGTGL